MRLPSCPESPTIPWVNTFSHPHITTILFDLDGTLIDSEATAARVVKESFREWWGIELDPEDAAHVTGRTWDSMWNWIETKYKIPLGREQALSQLVERYRAHLEQDLVEIPGAAAAVRALHGEVRLALVSGSHRREIFFALEQLKIRECFEVIYGAEDYLRSKPAPDGYQKAMRTLGVDPASTLVFEDSEAGIASGLAAGTWVTAIRAANHFNHDQSPAHLQIDDLRGVTPEWLRQVQATLRKK